MKSKNRGALIHVIAIFAVTTNLMAWALIAMIILKEVCK